MGNLKMNTEEKKALWMHISNDLHHSRMEEQGEIAELKRKDKKQRSELQKLKRDIQKLKRENTSLQRDNNKIDRKIQYVSNENKSLKLTMEQIKSMSMTDVTELEDVVSQLKERKNNLTMTIRELQSETGH